MNILNIWEARKVSPVKGICVRKFKPLLWNLILIISEINLLFKFFSTSKTSTLSQSKSWSEIIRWSQNVWFLFMWFLCSAILIFSSFQRLANIGSLTILAFKRKNVLNYIFLYTDYVTIFTDLLLLYFDIIIFR